MILQLSLQNQQHFAGEPFVLLGTNSFITGGLLQESVIFFVNKQWQAQGK